MGARTPDGGPLRAGGAEGRGAAVVVVMGVCGAGKTTAGAAAAAALGRAFLDADDLHPQANVERMRAGLPLRDEDRLPWLDRVGAEAAERAPCVCACSALTPLYRARLAAAAAERGGGGALFVHLRVPSGELRRRVGAREHAFMPPGLLQSQLETLQLPAGGAVPSSDFVEVDGAQPPFAVARAIADAARARR
eukprot:PRCOL_00003203-RA